MIDMFSLALSHGLMLLAAWRLVARADLDNDRASPGGEKTDLLGRPIGAEESGRDA
ncbi:hypothetical protein [Parasphingopyxis marina]|uniref:Uncharacterized protein n=1 Tax=Parasphingopyxis marina TaxID=2761622 RepID=A0A842I153_9SPHN|nr:hypothetical protein [Parasphingopyxis marina]MBC2778423.1 hypothetical protein [Parasphingopyxis marina]